MTVPHYSIATVSACARPHRRQAAWR